MASAFSPSTLASTPPLTGAARPALSPLQAVALTSTLFFAAVLAATQLSHQAESMTTLWFANAAAISAMHRRAQREWPAHLLGVALANGAIGTLIGDDVGRTLSFITGNLVEIALGSALLAACIGQRDALRRIRTLLAALLVGGLLPCAAGAAIGAALLTRLDPAAFPETCAEWFVSGAAGSLATLPLGLLLAHRGWRPLLAAAQRPAAAAGLIAAATVASIAPVWLPFPFSYLGLALVLLAGVGGSMVTALGVLVCSVAVDMAIALGWPHPVAGLASFHLPLLITALPPLMLAVALDTGRQRLRDSSAREAHFRTLYERTPAMMHSVDTDRRLLAVNDAWLARLGYTRDEVLGRRSTEFLTPTSRELAESSVIPRFLKQRELRDQEYQMVAKSGEVLDVSLSAIWECDDAGEPLRTLAVLTDVTEHKRLIAQLAAERERTAVTLHSIGDGVVATDETGRITMLNGVAEALIGWPIAQARGRPFAEVVRLLEQSGGAVIGDPVQACLLDPKATALPDGVVLRSQDGNEYGVQVCVSPILTSGSRVLGAVMVFQDVTEARGQARRLSYLAHHDSLTGLPNRVLLQDRVHQACQFGLRHDKHFAVVFMDLDHFKQVNDTHGHSVGDDLLRAVAERLSATLRSSDTICRLGGDEFVMLLADVASAPEAEALASKILSEIARPFTLDRATVRVGASLGTALFPGHGDNPDTLMKHADSAMYRAKRDGRDCHRLHEVAAA